MDLAPIRNGRGWSSFAGGRLNLSVIEAVMIELSAGLPTVLVPPGRIELPTSALPMMRSTTELRRRSRLGRARVSESRRGREAKSGLDARGRGNRSGR